MQALTLWVLGEWEKFDAWCCLHQIEPLHLPSRRFYAIVKSFLYEGTTEESVAKISKALKESEKEPHPYQKINKQKQEQEQVGWTRDKRGKWTPPPGWKPDGWLDDDTAYRVAQAAASGIAKVVS
jgi:hypothetical protein